MVLQLPISFDILYFCFHLFQDILNFLLWFFFFDPLVFKDCVNVHVFLNFPVWLLLWISSFIPLWLEKDTFYDFNLLKIVKTSFVAWHMVYPGGSSICAGKNRAVCYDWVGCSAYVCDIQVLRTVIQVLLFLIDLQAGGSAHYWNQSIKVFSHGYRTWPFLSSFLPVFASYLLGLWFLVHLCL